MRIGSVCTGYGGLDMAVQQVLGGELAWVADPDPGAAAILAHHHPEVPNLGDITTTPWASVEPVDVLTAGFPCQDISYAGRGAGIKEGTRSGLWSVIADALGVLRPGLVVLENVAGITVRRPGLDVVLADLAGLGFDAVWACVRASDAGAPHRRERWFGAAWPADAPVAGLQGGRSEPAGRGPESRGVSAADADGVGLDRAAAQHRADRWPLSAGDAAADAARDGRVEGRPEPAGQLGRPDATQRRGATLADADRDRREVVLGREPGVVARSDAHGRGPVDWGAYAAAVRRWEHVLGRPAPAATEPGRHGNPRLSPTFVEWLMGLPAGHVTAVPGLTRTQMLRALGNGVVPQQGALAIPHLMERAAADVEPAA